MTSIDSLKQSSLSIPSNIPLPIEIPKKEFKQDNYSQLIKTIYESQKALTSEDKNQRTTQTQ